MVKPRAYAVERRRRLGEDRLVFEPVAGRNAVVHWAWIKENHGCCGASCPKQAGGVAIAEKIKKRAPDFHPAPKIWAHAAAT
jgi:hypothetical protein